MKNLRYYILFLMSIWLFTGAARLQAKPATRSLETIVIDPGHGGPDIGAKGLSGLQEKNLCLELARQLALLLRQQLGLRVILTRDGDYALEQYERTAIANHNKADLFLSLHFNADFAAQQRGMEIYVLEPRSADNEDIAQVEGGILWDKAQLKSLKQSHRLAQAIYQQTIGSAYVKNIGIYSAPLLVLKGAAMPAVLLELAFITNQQEEEELWAKEYNATMAEALYRGILSYKRRFVDNPDQSK